MPLSLKKIYVCLFAESLYLYVLICFLGSNVLPWLGDLNKLGPLGDFAVKPYGEKDNLSPFPIKLPKKRSYSQMNVGWIKEAGLSVRRRKPGE